MLCFLCCLLKLSAKFSSLLVLSNEPEAANDSSKENLENIDFSDDAEKSKKGNSSGDLANDNDQLQLKTNIEDSTVNTAHSEL